MGCCTTSITAFAPAAVRRRRASSLVNPVLESGAAPLIGSCSRWGASTSGPRSGLLEHQSEAVTRPAPSSGGPRGVVPVARVRWIAQEAVRRAQAESSMDDFGAYGRLVDAVQPTRVRETGPVASAV